ncbi:two component transcriptional regulator, LytTR family [Chitinophaga terrae (ex Kim and Jung 2007)]|uniref:Two component transcriptional regulator, LytTR family n=1 Tax=Chitinophaga terrae (ex Kim and Jung 2007) TaxID=408074 RepID=A0A1H4AX50_9BACT|nr:LytTR family DNA-binding domain-containing protein [Chitinophaga terrae (ex Kim and Jung 2007)]MDQ0106807.1 two-component system LytT family response regulator [Chitinophaga terrae (ex Kim and Jung 2007)]GEP89095.1 DNA-binding response regulator [Chitinophaga terrae (ex Kim and Jung 2007)]SEA40358.1 two component transcriptional regulator, LytTR family [Chitinophaga terrae (ex Kim and Jung 2007)]
MILTGKITSVIVEDEAAATVALQNYLRKFCPQVEVTGTAQNSREAIQLLHELQPQLVFLDVEMPFGNAFDVLEGCQDLQFETIFVTAFSEYSLRALNQSAAYYLLKPVSIEELILAVNKVQQQLQQKHWLNRNRIIMENARESNPGMQQVILPTLDGFDVVKMNEIIRLRGNGNFTDVYLTNGTKKMVCRFLKHFSEMLPHPFVRVHKSHIINILYVQSYHKGAGGYVSLNDGTEVEVSPAYKDSLLKAFQ